MFVGPQLIAATVNHDATGRDWKDYAAEIGLSGGMALMIGIAFRIQRSGAYSRSQFEQLVSASPLTLESVSTRGINLILEMRK